MNKNTLKLGDWNAVCDICGFKYKASELRESGDLGKKGLMVCKKCYDPLHPQDLLRGREDNPSVPWSRPDTKGVTSSGTNVDGDSISTPVVVKTYGDESPTYTWGTSGANVIEFNTDLTANRTLTLAGSPDANNRLTITRTGGGAYTLDLGGVYTMPASIQMTVVLEYTGSVWKVANSYTLGL